MSINITIAIDGGEGSTTISSAASASMSATSSQTPSLLTLATQTMDAGAAPSEMELSNMVGLSSLPIDRDASVAKAGDTSAGSAPSEMKLSGIAGIPSPPVEQNIPFVRVGDIAAGSAPNFPSTEH
jgi:hypothetical protein